eukprot:CAMPEP_0182866350 /NCGR_PEP_ID=MMETSP0034_2-20130328/8155_1 /TAXON_ID=156128 /ORGANISM="Nephroselmis pyriformis, Strain CCMP717" /LENGTH=1148 /DNA_ID=CAMNT_0024998677 /DNA_START=108 /DNA_END=3552 /DNA_ORIENTATION=+
MSTWHIEKCKEEKGIEQNQDEAVQDGDGLRLPRGDVGGGLERQRVGLLPRGDGALVLAPRVPVEALGGAAALEGGEALSDVGGGGGGQRGGVLTLGHGALVRVVGRPVPGGGRAHAPNVKEGAKGGLIGGPRRGSEGRRSDRLGEPQRGWSEIPRLVGVLEVLLVGFKTSFVSQTHNATAANASPPSAAVIGGLGHGPDALYPGGRAAELNNPEELVERIQEEEDRRARVQKDKLREDMDLLIEGYRKLKELKDAKDGDMPSAEPAVAEDEMSLKAMMMSSQREIVFAASGTHPDPGAHAVKAWLTARGYKYTTDKSGNDVLVVGTGKNTMPTNYKGLVVSFEELVTTLAEVDGASKPPASTDQCASADSGTSPPPQKKRRGDAPGPPPPPPAPPPPREERIPEEEGRHVDLRKLKELLGNTEELDAMDVIDLTGEDGDTSVVNGQPPQKKHRGDAQGPPPPPSASPPPAPAPPSHEANSAAEDVIDLTGEDGDTSVVNGQDMGMGADGADGGGNMTGNEDLGDAQGLPPPPSAPPPPPPAPPPPREIAASIATLNKAADIYRSGTVIVDPAHQQEPWVNKLDAETEGIIGVVEAVLTREERVEMFEWCCNTRKELDMRVKADLPGGRGPSVLVLHLDGGHLQDAIAVADAHRLVNAGARAAHRLFTVVSDMRRRLRGTGMGVLYIYHPDGFHDFHPDGMRRGVNHVLGIAAGGVTRVMSPATHGRRLTVRADGLVARHANPGTALVNMGAGVIGTAVAHGRASFVPENQEAPIYLEHGIFARDQLDPRITHSVLLEDFWEIDDEGNVVPLTREMYHRALAESMALHGVEFRDYIREAEEHRDNPTVGQQLGAAAVWEAWGANHLKRDPLSKLNKARGEFGGRVLQHVWDCVRNQVATPAMYDLVRRIMDGGDDGRATQAKYWAAYNEYERAVAAGEDPPPLPLETAAYIAERLDTLHRGRATQSVHWDAYHAHQLAVAAGEDPPPLPLKTAAYIAERLDTLHRGRATQRATRQLAANQVYMGGLHAVLAGRADATFTPSDIVGRVNRSKMVVLGWINDMLADGLVVRQAGGAHGQGRYRAAALIIRRAPDGAGPSNAPPDFIFVQDAGLAAEAQKWAAAVPLCSTCLTRMARRRPPARGGGHYAKCW